MAWGLQMRQWIVQQALASYRALEENLEDLDEDEVIACLEFESQTTRRKAVLDRLISRAIRLNELRYSQQLQEKYKWHEHLPKS